ncbi:MarR family transcriptional regulator [Halorubrum sp. BOL3-1]|uniref:MarR family transcriptional regulator n=1 Tax=Halorubrum sp. BOL3-1 TaxID=2497325 RepID=UPI001004DAAF|nr:helix-turn-helix domain-containing protein [Halorubrum sp. BOL3-1]QAU12172.1 MarR family transcriptional regulator [Halorubrum sp. BOL3-1]
MATPEEALRRSNLLDTTPETDTYTILSFLCAHRESTVPPTAIADRTGCPRSTVATVLDRLEALGTIRRLADGVQIDTAAAETIARQLKSLDQVMRLFDAAPDDAYARTDWVSQVGTIDCVDEDEE